jgi:NAD(P) transhydrogenase subunit alpha
MKIAVPTERRRGEQRVALVPESCKRLLAAGVEVAIEAGAGAAASFPDAAYEKVGVAIRSERTRLLAEADFVCAVNPPELEDVAALREGAVLLGSLFPTRNLEVVKALAARRVTAFSTDCIPRTTRAQAMDTLSSQANITGYKGALLGALELPKYYPMFMTAAGTTLAAKVFVVGAGVAGLQAIATARRLGASVTATDVRPEVKEQIESVGAKYVGIELGQAAAAGGGYARELSAADRARQAQLLAEHCATVDVVITTALIGGVVAPKLLDEQVVSGMRPGSVIVDLGADGGGNCTLSRPGQTVQAHGVTILAPLNLPATVPHHASMLFSRNLLNFFTAFWNAKDKKLELDFADDILAGAVITRDGEVVHAPTKKLT